MNVPPEIVFHDMDRSQWVEDYILERLGHMEKLADNITSARVILTRDQGSHHKGNLYRVTVDVRLPPHHELAARKERNVGDMHEELRPLIKSAFDALESQLRETVEKRRRDVKTHQEGPREAATREPTGEEPDARAHKHT
jgi:ribosome-associated translation inhibitor RaiA